MPLWTCCVSGSRAASYPGSEAPTSGAAITRAPDWQPTFPGNSTPTPGWANTRFATSAPSPDCGSMSATLVSACLFVPVVSTTTSRLDAAASAPGSMSSMSTSDLRLWDADAWALAVVLGLRSVCQRGLLRSRLSAWPPRTPEPAPPRFGASSLRHPRRCRTSRGSLHPAIL